MKKILLFFIIFIINYSASAQDDPTFVEGSLSPDGSSGELLFNGAKVRVLCVLQGSGNIPSMLIGTGLLAQPVYIPTVVLAEGARAYKFWGEDKNNLEVGLGAYSTIWYLEGRIANGRVHYYPISKSLRWHNDVPSNSITKYDLPTFKSAAIDPPAAVLKAKAYGKVVNIDLANGVMY